MFYYVLRKTQEFDTNSWEISLIYANIDYIRRTKMFGPFAVFSSEMAFSRLVSPPYTLWTVNDVLF